MYTLKIAFITLVTIVLVHIILVIVYYCINKKYSSLKQMFDKMVTVSRLVMFTTTVIYWIIFLCTPTGTIQELFGRKVIKINNVDGWCKSENITEQIEHLTNMKIKLDEYETKDNK
jgi:nitrogen fixation/metabolism regulation signal transduction histidine kinase